MEKQYETEFSMQKNEELIARNCIDLLKVVSDKKEKRILLFTLLTKCQNLFREKETRKEEESEILSELKKVLPQLKEIAKSIIKTPIISEFMEDGTPYYEERFILLDENTTIDQKRKKQKKWNTFNVFLNLLNQAKIRSLPNYNHLKDQFVITFLEELEMAENRWIIDRFDLTKSHHEPEIKKEMILYRKKIK